MIKIVMPICLNRTDYRPPNPTSEWRVMASCKTRHGSIMTKGMEATHEAVLSSLSPMDGACRWA